MSLWAWSMAKFCLILLGVLVNAWLINEDEWALQLQAQQALQPLRLRLHSIHWAVQIPMGFQLSLLKVIQIFIHDYFLIMHAVFKQQFPQQLEVQFCGDLSLWINWPIDFCPLSPLFWYLPQGCQVVGCFLIIYHLLVKQNSHVLRVSFSLPKATQYPHSFCSPTHLFKTLIFNPHLNPIYLPHFLPILLANSRFALLFHLVIHYPLPPLVPTHSILLPPVLPSPTHQTIPANLHRLDLHCSLSHC